jgi:hypothetical protein
MFDSNVRGNPGFFREFFIEQFITVNAQGNFQPEGPGGGKGYRGHEVASTLRREAPLREPGIPPKRGTRYLIAKIT